MIIKWDRLMENEKGQFEKMTAAERFVYFLLLQYRAPYLWGKENPEGSDCSGAVCMALYAATGLLIRTSADGLYRRVFTRTTSGPGDIRAAFFVTRKDRKHGEGKAAAGTAVHVAGLLDEGVVLNSQEPGARVRVLSDIAAYFARQDCGMEVRGLNKMALSGLAAAGARYGLDAEFSRYFEK